MRNSGPLSPPCWAFCESIGGVTSYLDRCSGRKCVEIFFHVDRRLRETAQRLDQSHVCVGDLFLWTSVDSFLQPAKNVRCARFHFLQRARRTGAPHNPFDVIFFSSALLIFECLIQSREIDRPTGASTVFCCCIFSHSVRLGLFVVRDLETDFQFYRTCRTDSVVRLDASEREQK